MRCRYISDFDLRSRRLLTAYRLRVIDAPEAKGLRWKKLVNGERYEPIRPDKRNDHFVAEGIASWYGRDFHDSTSNGEIYDIMSQLLRWRCRSAFGQVTNQASSGRWWCGSTADPLSRGASSTFLLATNELGSSDPARRRSRIRGSWLSGKDSVGHVAYRQPELCRRQLWRRSRLCAGQCRRLVGEIKFLVMPGFRKVGWRQAFYRCETGRYRTSKCEVQTRSRPTVPTTVVATE
jgi:hypothetical protein